MTADCQLLIEAAPSFARVQNPTAPARFTRRTRLVLSVVVAAHLMMIGAALRRGEAPRAVSANSILDIVLIAAAPPVPVQPTSASRKPAPVRHAAIAQPRAQLPAVPAPQAETPETPIVIFNRDGSVQLPAERRTPRPFEPDVAKGVALMSSGLNCGTSDNLSTHESLSEETARKYLSWLGLYNPYYAQLRAEKLEERQARCKRWKEPTVQ